MFPFYQSVYTDKVKHIQTSVLENNVERLEDSEGGQKQEGEGREGWEGSEREKSLWGNVLAMQIQAEHRAASSLCTFNPVSTVHLDITVGQITDTTMSATAESG